MLPEWKVADQSPKKVRIKGKALFAFEKFFKQGISGNQRKYIQDEITRSARTLRNIPIDVNHEISVWEEQTNKNWNTYQGSKPHAKGHAMWGEEENGELEYVAEINDPIYREKVVDTVKVRNDELTVAEYKAKWGKLPLAGVSVDADFLHLMCTKCDDGKRYFDLNEYRRHMEEIHFIKNIELEPRGIAYKRLSLVEPPQKPGVEGASFELVETLDGMHQLYEALRLDAQEYVSQFDMSNPYQSYDRNPVITQKEEKEKLSEEQTRRYAVSRDDKITFDPRRTNYFTEQDDGPPAEREPCPEGQHWNEESQECVPDAASAATEQQEEKCEEGTHWDAEASKCVPDAPSETKEQQECPDNMHWDADQDTCVPNEPPHEPVPAMELLKLGEPFADYSSFDDCVSKNQEKDDPEAYCADIKRKTEETVKPLDEGLIRKIVQEELLKQSTSLTDKHEQEAKELKEKQERETTRKLIKDIKEELKRLGFSVASIVPRLTAVEQIEKKRCARQGIEMDHIKQNREMTLGMGKTVNLMVQALERTDATLSKLEDDTSWKPHLETVTSDLSALTETVKQMDSAINVSHQEFNQQIKNLTKEHEETTIKQKQSETQSETRKMMETLIKRVENLSTHVKPEFKGSIPQSKTETDDNLEVNENPYAGN